jgi:hypothetical protein
MHVTYNLCSILNLQGDGMVSFREVRFLLCTVAVIMVYKINGAGWLLNVAGGNALVNLFTGQYLCTTSICSTEKPGIVIPGLPFRLTIPTDPLTAVHYATTAIGLISVAYGAVIFWF